MSGPMGFGMPIGGAALPAGIVVLGAAGQGSVGEIVTSDPSTGSGLKRSPGTVVAKSDGSTVWLKTGTANTAWSVVPGGADTDAVAVTKRTMLGLLALTGSQVDTWVEDFNKYSTLGDSTTFGSEWIRTVGVNSHVEHLTTGGPAGGIARILKDNTVNTWEENSLLFNGPGFPANVRSWALNFRCYLAAPSLGGSNVNNNLFVGLAQGTTGTIASLAAGAAILVGYAGASSTAFVNIQVGGANVLSAYSLATLDSVWRDITIVGLYQGAGQVKVQTFVDFAKISESTVTANYAGGNPFFYTNRGELRVDTMLAMVEREK